MTVTVAQLRERIDEQVLIQLTDPNGQAVDETKLARALTDAAGIIEGYTFRLPESARPPASTLDAYQISLGLYVLAGNRPGAEFDSIRARAKAAIDYLDKLLDSAPAGIDVETSGDEPQITTADMDLFVKGGQI
jgi:phage gp36-like protein